MPGTDFYRRELATTSDGSHTLKLEGLDEHFHSTHGALQESMHVFIQHGLMTLEPLKIINILEVGFGTGLNALLAMQHSLKNRQHLNYCALEPYPLIEAEYRNLNFISVIGDFALDNHFQKMHNARWDETTEIFSGFSITKNKTGIQDCKLNKNTFHLVFFDAFAPDIQPEMWTEEVFEKIFTAMRPGGVLVTYCAKGIVRRAMKSAGFCIERLPGPPGKREITRAVKTSKPGK